MAKKLQIDWLLFSSATILSLFGVVMIYSASAVIALKETNGASQYGYFYKQLILTLVGIGVMFLATRFDYRWLKSPAVVFGLIILTVFLLGAVFAFPATLGARRWIKLAGMSFQPSELAKVSLALYLAAFLAKRSNEMREVLKTFVPCALILALFGILIFPEPDLGTVVVLAAVFGMVYFAAGAPWLYVLSVLAAFVVGIIGAIVFFPYRMKRWLAFLDPCDADNAQGVGFQLCQSLLAVGSGGVWGSGFASGQQKLHYLPFAHSDFIFAVVGEELGLVGCLIVVALFGLFLWRASLAVLRAPDRFGMLLGIGLLTGIIFQAFFNMSVVIALMPTKGIPLPFISYGGSSILVTMLSVGLLLNLSQYSGFVEIDETEKSKKRPTKRRPSRTVEA